MSLSKQARVSFRVVAFLISSFGVWIVNYLMTVRTPARLVVVEQIAVDLLSPLAPLLSDSRFRVEWDRGVGLSTTPVPLRNLHAVCIVLRNTGGQPLRWQDSVTQPVTFSVEGKGEVLAVGSMNPADGPRSRFIYVRGGPDVTVEADYLNPDDAISLQVLHTSSKGPQLLLSGRLFDHPKLELLRPGDPRAAPTVWSSRVVQLVTFVAVGLLASVLAEVVIALSDRYRSGRSTDTPPPENNVAATLTTQP